MERKSSTKCKANTKRRAVRRRGGVEFQTYFYRKYPQYTYVYSKIKSFKGDYVYWHDLTDGFLDDLADWFKEEVSSGSARTYFAIIKSLIDKGKAAGYDIPCTNHHEILTAKPNKVVKTFLTLDELEKIEEYLPERDVEVYVRKNVLLDTFFIW